MRIWAPHDGTDPRVLAEASEEVWVPHSKYPFVYVSNLGNVTRRDGLAPIHEVNGYLKATITKQIRPYVHRLVLEAFDGTSYGRQARRVNKDKKDNRLCNLFWAKTRGKMSLLEKQEIKMLADAGLGLVEISRRVGREPSHVSYYLRSTKEKRHDAV